jgi:tRNA(adenine34) deaminase
MNQDTNMITNNDRQWMAQALAEAEAAHARGDWPTGAVIVKDGQWLASGQNRQVSTGDLLLHAEPDAIRQALTRHGPGATQGATLYCTMEPCPMCAGALKLAGITRLVLALRHERLQRSDLGSFSVEAFCALTGHGMAIDDGVLEAPYLALRLRWGQDQVAGR